MRLNTLSWEKRFIPQIPPGTKLNWVYMIMSWMNTGRKAIRIHCSRNMSTSPMHYLTAICLLITMEWSFTTMRLIQVLAKGLIIQMH